MHRYKLTVEYDGGPYAGFLTRLGERPEQKKNL